MLLALLDPEVLLVIVIVLNEAILIKDDENKRRNLLRSLNIMTLFYIMKTHLLPRIGKTSQNSHSVKKKFII